MSENHLQRILIVLTALFVALLAIFWPAVGKVIHPSQKVTQWLNLNPGIDMVGGTSLLYEIKAAPGARNRGTTNLAEQVMTALKRRVDPDGVKNLIWRPQGNNRLEIQIPFSGTARDSQVQRTQLAKDLTAARTELNATNVATADVTDAIEGKNGRTRADLDKLANGSAARLALFHQLAGVYDDLQKAHAAQNADDEARLRAKYQAMLEPKGADGQPDKNPIAATNLSIGELDSAVTLTDKNARATRLKDLRLAAQDFPARLAAIDHYVNASDALSKLKDSVDDAEDLKRLLRGSGVLEFHILVEPGRNDSDAQASMEEYQKMTARLRTQGPRVEAGDQSRWYTVDKPEDFKHNVSTYEGKSYVLAWTTPERSLDARPGQKHWALTRAQREVTSNNEQVVGFTFDAQGGALFGNLTGNNINRSMAIMLDDKVISAPNIRSRINESGTIDGGGDGFSPQELDYLINTLTAGSLPAQLADEPISERTVGPQLGEDNLRRGLIACGLGLVVVGVFLVTYYHTAGIVAFFTVLMNVALILGTMAALQATFTLPSIAGIVLTIGTAVDANVLIFERLREEQHRGLSLKMALRNAYDKAFSAIIDSNMTTAITSVFLIVFGTEEVKGFGVTLIIGIVASLFTALFVTRTIFNLMIDRFGLRKLGSLPLSYPKWDKLLRPNIDWMGMAWVFYVFSFILVGIGLVLFVVKVHQREMFAIEFASGTSVQFQLKQPMKQEEVRKLMAEKADSKILPDANPVSVSSGGVADTTYEVITPNADSAKVKDEILRVLGDRLEIVRPSKFNGSGSTAEAALDQKAIVPVTAENATDTSAWPGFLPPKLRDYVGGVAIVMKNIDPPLSPSLIRERVTQQQLQADTPATAAQREFVVLAPNGDADTSTAVIVTKDETLPYGKDKDQWQSQLAAPMWKLVNEAVGRPAQLQQVKNFDPSVAGDAQKDALLTLAFSVIVIMVYIWVRFGNLKYGTATVVALLHDTLFTIAALGLAHYLYGLPGFKSILQLEPFRIDLTVVAGILTIMGYSMIDTIVVFDRIRENRGKFGVVSRHVINDAVNQTLSRTLLTAGTTTMTVAIMYFFGGPGIHGFTFVLLIGILVGTYSSVAIAAPILLLGNPVESTGSKRELEKSAARPAGSTLQQAGT